jgi:hypothetical protein
MKIVQNSEALQKTTISIISQLCDGSLVYSLQAITFAFTHFFRQN